MINFALVKGITLPEGNVKQMADASGRVLWSVDDGMRTVTINGMGDSTYCYVTIDGVKYYGSIGNVITINVPAGTVMSCYVGHPASSGYTKAIQLNGTMVSMDKYNHVITTDMTVATMYANASAKVSNIQLKEV